MQDHFQRLGLPRRFSVEAGELERAYIASSRAVHPDYHLAGSDAQLNASLEASAAVNEAYNTLRDPFARADHLLTLDGEVPVPGNAKLPPAFLADMLEAREAINASRGNPAEVDRLDAAFEARYRELMDRMSAVFEGYDRMAADDLLSPITQAKIRDLLNRAKYVRRLMDDLHAD